MEANDKSTIDIFSGNNDEETIKLIYQKYGIDIIMIKEDL